MAQISVVKVTPRDAVKWRQRTTESRQRYCVDYKRTTIKVAKRTTICVDFLKEKGQQIAALVVCVFLIQKREIGSMFICI